MADFNGVGRRALVRVRENRTYARDSKQRNARNSWALLGRRGGIGGRPNKRFSPLRTWLEAFKTCIHHVAPSDFWSGLPWFIALLSSHEKFKNLQSPLYPSCTTFIPLYHTDLCAAYPNNPLQASSQSIW